MTDKERYATIGTWAEVFFQEGNPVATHSIKIRLDEAGVMGETFRDRLGRLVYKGFYSESEVRKNCANLLENLPVADEAGFVVMEGERYATALAWGNYFRSKEGLSVSSQIIYLRLKQAGVVGKTARNRTHRILENLFYSEADVQKACGDLLRPLLQADDDGLLMVDGEKHRTIAHWARLFRVGQRQLAKKFKSSLVTPVKAKLTSGQIHIFYPESCMLGLIPDLSQDLPVADEDGFITVDDKRYGTIGRLSETLGLSPSIVERRLEGASCEVISGKTVLGRRRQFYLESAIRELCEDALRVLPRADVNGIINLDGLCYSTVKGISRVLGIARSAISSHIEESGIRPIEGRTSFGKTSDYYCTSEVRKILQEVIHDFSEGQSGVSSNQLRLHELEDLPRADEEGLLHISGECYCSVTKMARIFGIGTSTIKSRIQSAGIASLMARFHQGRKSKFYPLSTVRELCGDLILQLPKSNEDGTIMLGNVRYGSVSYLAMKLGFCAQNVRARVNSSTIPSIRGVMSNGRSGLFYAENDAYALFADIVTLPVANAEGFIVLEGVRYGTIGGIASTSKVSDTPIRARLEKANIVPIRGRSNGGLVHDFYPENELKRLYADIPQADAEGFIAVGNERYGTITSLKKAFDLPRCVVQERIEKSCLQPVEGRDTGGKVHKFYSETTVRELCHDRLQPIPSVDESGFLTVDGIRFGTVGRLASFLEVYDSCLRARVKKFDLKATKVRSNTGNIRDVYSEVEIRAICADLIAKRQKTNDR